MRLKVTHTQSINTLPIDYAIIGLLHNFTPAALSGSAAAFHHFSEAQCNLSASTFDRVTDLT